MEDYQIVDLYWARSEYAIRETDQKYGRMLNGISYSLLASREDAEECVNDTYLTAWQRMPEDRPAFLGAYLSKIIRCLSVDRFRASHRQKRGGMGQVLEELTECIPGGESPGEAYENRELSRVINDFLEGLEEEKRRMFVRRYFYSDSIADVAERMKVSQAKVKTTLYRIRGDLKRRLEEERICL
ncbi:MAG: RNA polymerase sigma factor [Clostridia bacterium]|nr:RNA polymerase sigma factor [Clostridia bacterium]